MDPQQQTRWRCSSLLLWARQTGDIDRLLHGARQHGMRGANAGSATLSNARRKLNTDLVGMFCVFVCRVR